MSIGRAEAGPRFAVLQHVECEPPGTIGTSLARRGVRLDVIRLYAGDPVPDLRAYDALLAFGGPMNVDEDGRYPWLREEKRAIGEAVRAGTPFLGVCLGAQLLSRALGSRVYEARAPEVGVLEVALTELAPQDPIFSRLDDPLVCLQWHGDTFDLPGGSVLLATSDVCANQAFRWGDGAWGLQFHVEVTEDLAEAWAEIPAYCSSLEAACGPDGLPRLSAALAAERDRLASASERVVEGFLEVVTQRATESSRG